jgi:hypothetical protein
MHKTTLKERNLRIYAIDDVKSMFFDKLDRLMPNTVDFTDSDIDSTHTAKVRGCRLWEVKKKSFECTGLINVCVFQFRSTLKLCMKLMKLVVVQKKYGKSLELLLLISCKERHQREWKFCFLG